MRYNLIFLVLLVSLFKSIWGVPVVREKENVNQVNNEQQHYLLGYKRSVFERERRRLHNIPVMNWFVDRVDRWAHPLQDMLLDNKITNDLLLKKLQRLCGQLYHAKTEKQTIALLQELVKVYDIFQKMENNTKDQETIEYFHCALLLKSSVILVHSAVVNLLHMLDVLVECQDYWIMQERHPWHYYFHKSPLKWFNKDSQYAEVARNKKVITKVLEKYDRILGQLVHFIHSFDAQASVQQQYNWLHQLTKIINLIVRATPHKGDININFSNIAHTFITQFTLLPHHLDKIVMLMSHAQKPNHFVRHWIGYTALIGFCTYCYVDPHLILTACGAALISWYRKKDDEGNTFFERWVTKPLADIKSVVWEGQVPEKWQEQDNEIVRVEALLEVQKEILEQLEKVNAHTDTLSLALQQSDDLLKNSLEEVIERIAQAATAEEKKAILYYILTKREITPLLEHLKSLDKPSVTGMLWQNKVLPGNIDAFLEQCLDSISAGKMSVVEKGLRADVAPTLIEMKANILKIKAAGLTDAIHSAKSINQRAAWGLNVLYDLLKKNNLSLKILALAPAALTGVGLFKGIGKIYKRLMDPNFKRINNLLCDVEKVLIKSTDIMDYALYGKLIHLLHQLKHSAGGVVSTKDDTYGKFVGDIQELESYDFNAREKEKLILLMRQRYDFLK